jgi:hypothetical protein
MHHVTKIKICHLLYTTDMEQVTVQCHQPYTNFCLLKSFHTWKRKYIRTVIKFTIKLIKETKGTTYLKNATSQMKSIDYILSNYLLSLYMIITIHNINNWEKYVSGNVFRSTTPIYIAKCLQMPAIIYVATYINIKTV